MQQRLDRQPDAMKLRRQTVEHPFGTLKAWEALRTLAAEDARDPSISCKPFAKDRSGLVLGEGAAMVVLEDRERALSRGVRVIAEMTGYGLCTDASHITRPSVDGQAQAMALALASAGIASDAIAGIRERKHGRKQRRKIRRWRGRAFQSV